jgi:asparagine synthase (glutamine-hydrolysing)
LADLLWESVELRLMSDVPLGAFLSGGIDSTTIVAIMSQIVQEPVRTFCIGYDVGGSDYDDTYYARLAAKRFNASHRELRITADDIVSSLPGFIYYLDQPSSDAINSYFVSRLAAEDVTVVLCGQGGDELFAGYSSFSILLKLLARDEKWQRIPAPVRALAAASLQNLPASLKRVGVLEKATRFLENYGSFVKKYAQIRMEIPENLKRGIYSDHFLGKLNGADTFSIYNEYLRRIENGVDPVNKVSYLDLKTHLGDILMRDVDVMSMAFSLETRVPLIDHLLVEFAATIPGHMKLRNGQAKHIYVESVRDLLPPEIVHRKKLGFNFPLAIWLRKELRPLVDFVLSEHRIAETGLFRYEGVQRLKEDFYSGKEVPYRRVWGLVILELWLRGVYEQDESFMEELASYMPSKVTGL